jgi:hypothetical protein
MYSIYGILNKFGVDIPLQFRPSVHSNNSILRNAGFDLLKIQMLSYIEYVQLYYKDIYHYITERVTCLRFFMEENLQPHTYNPYICLGDNDKNHKNNFDHMIITTAFGIICKIEGVYITIPYTGNFLRAVKIDTKNNSIHELLKHDDKVMEFVANHIPTENRLLCNGIHTTSFTTDHFSFDRKNKKLDHLSYFVNHKTNLICRKKMLYDFDKKTEHTLFNKNGLSIYYYTDYVSNLSRIISKCMMEDESGIRFRGVYKSIKKGDKYDYISLEKDDEILYLKKNEDVLVKLNPENRKNRDTTTIGWKVAENEYGEKRIIKLIILPDAKIIRPIDEEYFHTKGKERCNRAIVADIQYPDEEKEGSVVPNETVAYSYLFSSSNNKFEYKIGQEVIPDSFDEDENVSCTNGIHFYRDRKKVFDVYVKR